jgi:hypothetical protein
VPGRLNHCACLLLLIAAVAVLHGCATNPRDEIAAGRARLIPDSVSIEPWGLNYKVKGVVELKGARVGVQTWATDCQKGKGSLKSTDFVSSAWSGGSWIGFNQLTATGTTEPDKLFHDICAAGLRLAFAAEASLTPEARKAREERMQMQFPGTPRPP